VRTIDLFAGCGGLSLGFTQAGYTVVAAFDHWQPAIQTYQQNFKHPIFACDLNQFSGDGVGFFRQFAPEMIIGGPPCQDFSSAGKRDESLGRADLTIVFAEIVTAVSPSWFVMENVERAQKSATFQQARAIFKQAGYGLTEKVLDASLCGVPQQRKRLFIIGQLHGSDDALLPYLAKNLAPSPMTVREYLGEQLQIEYYYRHPRSYKRRAIFSVDEPSPTIRGVNRPIPQGYPGHPGDRTAISPDLRPLTTKERSLLQTFPEHFTFVGNKAEMEQLIGNAVPVKLAEYVAQAIIEFLQDGGELNVCQALEARGYQGQTREAKAWQLALFPSRT
jgi:DNA (cytosine-5)-methyltransferase 1